MKASLPLKLIALTLVGARFSEGQAVYYPVSSTYIGNSWAVTNAGADGAPPLVIVGEFNPGDPSSTSSATLTTGEVTDVKFYGRNFNFTLYALSLETNGPGANAQTFQVVASQNISGTAPTAGLQTYSLSGFSVSAGDLLAFAGTGPYYPQSANDAPYSDATYENSSAPGSFTATPPGGPGSEFTVGLHNDASADYDYVSDTFGNQGRAYAIGVDVSWAAERGFVDFGYVPVGTTSSSSNQSWGGASFNGTEMVIASETFIGPNAADFSVNPNYTGVTLNSGQTYPYALNFSPVVAGFTMATFTNYETPNPPFGPAIEQVRGIGIPSARPPSGPIVPELAPIGMAVSNFLVMHQFEAATIALMHNSRLVLREGYGWRDTNFTTVIHPDNLFRLASVSKMLTGSAILKLAGEGYFSTNTLVYNYLGIQPWGGVLGDSRIPNITIQMLLDHSGGWDRDTSPVGDPPFDTIEISSDLNLDYPAAPTDVIRWMFSKPLDFAPGTDTNYCNFGYQILGRVIEKATGKPYIDYIQQDLLGGAGISNSLGFLNVIQAHSRPRDLAPWEIWYADPRSLDPLGPSAVDYPAPLIAQAAYGGDYYESYDSCGGLSASAIGLCNYLLNYWESGVQRLQGEGYGWYLTFYGSLPGCTSVLDQHISQSSTSTNGLEFAALFNERDSDDETGDTSDNVQAEAVITNAAAGITSWPASGGGEIEWGAAAAATAETSGSLTVNLVRLGPTTLPVKVSYTTYSLTADSSDYVPTSGIVAFAAYQTTATVTVNILNKVPLVAARQFSLELISASGGAWLGSQLSCVVTITATLQTGSLQVTLSPAAAITAGAQWRVDGDPWQKSGAKVVAVPVGNHTLSFSPVSGWVTPPNQTVSVRANTTTTATVTYAVETGSVEVNILPALAVNDGALWQLDGGPWQSSGATVSGLPLGNFHTMSFNSITGWTTPGRVTIWLGTDDPLVSYTATYDQQFGSLRVTISPAAPVADGAQWQLDYGPWQNSGATLTGVSVGPIHTVSFNMIRDWMAPVDQTVSVKDNVVSNLTGSYTFKGEGIYNGLFSLATETNEATSGMLSGLDVTASGTYSGKLLIGGGTNAIAGSFANSSGQATNKIRRTAKEGGPLTLEMTLNWNDSPPKITGTVSGGSDGLWTADLLAELPSNESVSAEYTALMLPAGPPPGWGYILITNHAGMVTLSGALADGTPFSQTVPLLVTHDLPVYANLYASAGLLLGRLGLESGVPTGILMWIKPASRSTLLYTSGFTNPVVVVGSLWTNPLPHTAAIDLPSGQLDVSGGIPALPLIFYVAVSNNNALAKLPGSPTNSLTGSINPRTGLMRLSFGNGAGKATTTATGAVLQSVNDAAGFILGKTNAGAFNLKP